MITPRMYYQEKKKWKNGLITRLVLRFLVLLKNSTRQLRKYTAKSYIIFKFQFFFDKDFCRGRKVNP